MKLEKLVLTVGKKTLELTPNEAKELKAILSELFAEEKTKYIPYPQIIEKIVERRPYWYPNWTLNSDSGTVYCSNSKDTANAETFNTLLAGGK